MVPCCRFMTIAVNSGAISSFCHVRSIDILFPSSRFICDIPKLNQRRAIREKNKRSKDLYFSLV
jgi:hypothetical protein